MLKLICNLQINMTDIDSIKKLKNQKTPKSRHPISRQTSAAKHRYLTIFIIIAVVLTSVIAAWDILINIKKIRSDSQSFKIIDAENEIKTIKKQLNKVIQKAQQIKKTTITVVNTEQATTTPTTTIINTLIEKIGEQISTTTPTSTNPSN